MSSRIELTFAAVEAEEPVVKVIELVARLLKCAGDSVEPQLALQLHPLGFVALVWPVDEVRILRLHYWDRAFAWGQPSEFHIHDHVFEFRSAVLLGSIRNDIYSVRNDVDGRVMYVTEYDGQRSILNPSRDRFLPVLETSETHNRGAIYRMPAGVLHQTELLSCHALTVLASRYSLPRRSGARVLGDDSGGIRRVFTRAAMSSDQAKALLESISDAVALAQKECGLEE